jgi:Tfp pilus assembly protein PilN
VGLVVGIGLVALMGILVLHNRANIETLGSQVMSAEATVAQQQREVTQLSTNVASTKGRADALHNTLVTIERGRAVILDDLREINKLAGESLTLGTVSHVGGSVTINGGAPNVDEIFRYARALRDSKDSANNPRFSSVWISSIAGDGAAFSFALTK